MTVVVNGKLEIASVKIDPEAFNAEDIAELEVMVLAATKDAQSKASDAQTRLTTNITSNIKIPGMF